MTLFARRAFRAAVVVALVLVSKPSIAEDADPLPSGPVSMTEGGAFFDQIDPRTGAMTYSYRFELPKARGVSGPSLALQYNSSARDREAGYGWGLDLPSIELRPLSGLAQFDAAGRPLLPSDRPGEVPFGHERYVFQGQSLVKICDVGGACPSEPSTQGHPGWANGWAYYRPHVEGMFARFYRSPDRLTWRVQLKGSGEVVDFGTPVAPAYGMPAAIESKGTGIVRWHPVIRRDLQHPNNVVLYRWQSYGAWGIVLLTDIYDTPSVSAPTDVSLFAHHTQLDWDRHGFPSGNRQAPDRAIPDYRLKRVAVASMPWSGVAPREVYRVYTLDYYSPRGSGAFDPATQAPLWHHSFLQQIKVEGHCSAQTENGDGTIGPDLQCRPLPPVRFEYEPGSNIGEMTPTAPPIDSGPPGAVDNNAVLPYPTSAAIVDFDRDGLPDVVQSWEDSRPDSGFRRRTAVRIPNETDQAELWSLQPLDDDGHPIGGTYDYKIGSARPILGYLNRGSGFRYQCMDAGDRFNPITIAALNAGPWTEQQEHVVEFFNPASSRSPNGPIQASNTALGAFENALGVWGRNQYRPFFARSVAVPQFEPGQEPPALALGGCSLDEEFDNAAFFPRWQWESQKLANWTYPAPSRPTVNDAQEWFVDVDGDGYADVLRPVPDLPAPRELRGGTVAFTRKYGTGEPTPGTDGGQPIVGPALLPLVDDSAAPQNTLVPVDRPWDPSPTGRKTQVFYADMNGDGLPDLVTSNYADSAGTLRIRPGDGSGTFSCAAASDPWPCIDDPDDPNSSFYEATITSPQKPWWAVRNGYNVLSFFQIHDVTGDGLADIIRYNAHEDGTSPAGVEVWVNLDGQTFACVGAGGSCSIGNVVDATPAHPGFVDDYYRLAFADMNADGVDDIVVLARQGVFRASFFASSPSSEPARGTRPGQLIRIRSGFGATTKIQYHSIQDLDLAASASESPWTHHSPIVEAVVTNLLTEDAATAAGDPPLDAPYGLRRNVKYTYRDPAYDAWQRKLVGFRKFATQLGDEAAITETTSWFGPCENAAPPSRDVNGQESVNFCPKGSDDEFTDAATFRSWVGKPVRVDRYIPADSGQGVPQQMLWSRYYEFAQPITLFSPENDRHVTFTFAQRVETHLYRPEQVASPGSDFLPLAGGDRIELPPVQAGSKTIEQSVLLDTNGTLLERRESGDAAEGDQPIVQQFSDAPFGGALAVTCDETWRCLPTYVSTSEDYGGSLAVRRQTRFTYDSTTRDLTQIDGYLENGHFLDRAHESGAPISYAPPGMAAAGWKTLAHFDYSEQGVVILAMGPGDATTAARACTRIDPDDAYGQFPKRILNFKDGCDSPSGLETNVAFDRGFGVQVSTTAADLGVSMVTLDEFGRPSETFAPAPDEASPAMTKTAHIEYGDGGPVNYVDATRFTAPADGGPIRSVQLFNGLLEPVLRFDQGDGGHWNASGWTERNSSGRIYQTYRTFDAGGTDPVTVAQGAAWTSPSAATHFYFSADGFGRTVGATDDGTPVLERTFEPLAVETRDAEQIAPTVHAGAFTRTELTTRGQVRRTLQYFANGGLITTGMTYDVSGNPNLVYRTGSDGQNYWRYTSWDSLGRLIENYEPNTRDPVNDRHWLYAWDDANHLVGTSDGRGCGKDIYYDSLSRVVGEDYSPCRSSQPEYTAANTLTGDNFEVLNTYDNYEIGQVDPDLTFADDPLLATGRLVATRDRGAHTQLSYDTRGRVRRVGRQVASPLSQQAAGADPYAPHLFRTRSDFDNADRLTSRTSGADEASFVDNPWGLSAETYAYSPRGMLESINSSYGSIIQYIGYDVDGLTNTVTYGDFAATQSTFGYDSRRRMTSYTVQRAAPALWSAPSGNYTAPSPTDTAQTMLADFAYTYDLVGNPTMIEDKAPASDWRVIAAPQRSRAIEYDDLYRVTSVAYGYGAIGGSGTFRSPFKAETNAGDTRPVPVQVQFETRVQNETFAYDSLGNLTSSTDDQLAAYDRSLGTITNGYGTGRVRTTSRARAA